MRSWCYLLFAGHVFSNACPPLDHESVLQPGYDYSYRLENGASTQDKNKISVQCDVSISHSDGCFYLLHLDSCFLNASQNVDHRPLPELSKYSILFSLVNGEIPEIYTDEKDAMYCVNIKRAVLSAFVFKLSYVTRTIQELHTDFQGTCPLTSTTFNKKKGSVRTTKDIRRCVFPTRWEPRNKDFVQSISNSTVECEYEVNMESKRLEKVDCEELHAIQLEPFTTASVQSNILLTYVGSSRQTERKVFSSLSRKTHIIFEPEVIQDPPLNTSLSAAKKMLSELVEHSIDEIKLSTIPQFTHFVHWIKSSSDLMPLLEVIETCSYLTGEIACTPVEKEIGMSYFEDALLQCNTFSCFEIISLLVKNKGFTPNYHSWNNMHFIDPYILEHVKNICHSTHADECWIVLGTLLQRIFSTLQIPEDSKKEFQEIAKHFYLNIKSFCVSDSKMYAEFLRDLKAVKNMGRYYFLLIPDAHEHLIDCFIVSDVPDYVRTSIFEVLLTVDICNTEVSCENTYGKLLPVFRNKSTLLSVRTLTYELFLYMSRKFKFEEEVLFVLKTDEDLRLKSHLAHNLKSLFENAPLFKEGEKSRFIKSMKKLLEENELSLDRIIHESRAKSVSDIKTFSMNFPFPWVEFNLESYYSNIYYSIHNYLKNSFIFQMLHRLLYIFEFGVGGKQEILKMFPKIMKSLNIEISSFENVFKSIQDIAKNFGVYSKPLQWYDFQEEVFKNVRKLEIIHKIFKLNSRFSFHHFFEVLRNGLFDLSFDDIKDLSSKLFETQTLMRNFEQGLRYNPTKVVKLFEAHHQVPTMIGLPLKWSTEATLAFSLRSGLEVDFHSDKFEFYVEAIFRPSTAVTILNQVVMDFTSVTQIGVLSNFSVYSSVLVKAKLNYTEKKKVLSFEKPPKTQKILDLFHTNQLLKSYTQQDTDDWDTGVFSSLSCTGDRISSLLGLQFCLSESHPKPITQTPSLANPVHSKWQLLMHPINEKLKSYDLEIIQPNEMKSSEVILRFSTSGSDNKREILFNADMGTSKCETSFQAKIPPLPDFSILYLQNMLRKNGKENGYRVTASLKLCKNLQYELIYNEERKEKWLENYGTKSSGFETEPTIVRERSLSLGTLHNSYSISIVNHKTRLNIKILLSYENIDLSGAWLHPLLPSSLWESDLKAWIEFQITGEAEEKDKLIKKRQIICFIRDPQSITDLNADLLRMNERNQLIVNAIKKEICSQKVLAFASFYYDLRNEQIKESSEREIKIFNLTISQNSWAVEAQKEITEGKVLWEIVMRCKNAENSNNVRERTMLPTHAFAMHKNEIKFLVSAEVQVMGSQELMERYPTLTVRDVEGLGNQLTAVNVQFHYPFSSKQETASLDGYFIISGGSTTFRFQNDFIMESSYNNLQLTSHSVYKSDGAHSSFNHESHLPSTTRASNAILFWLSSPAGHCTEAGFRHRVVSRLFDLSTNVTYRCNSNGKDLHTLLLQSRMNSSVWNMLNLYINQIVEDMSPEYTYETCNVTHPSMVINVTADWKGEEMCDHRKTALFTCTKKDCQRTILLIEVLHSGTASAKLKLPNDENRTFSLRRTISVDAKNLNLRIKYSDNEEGESEDLQLKGKIINKNYHVWSLRIHLDTFMRVKSLLANSFGSIINSLVSQAQDPDHPVNKLTHSSIQMTLYDYFRNLRGQGNDLIRTSWTSLKDSLENLKPFFETPLTLVWNIASIGTMKEYHIIEEESAPGWFSHYFDLAVGFFKPETSIIETVLKKFLLDNKEFRWEFITGRVLKMESFREWPSLAFEFNPFTDKDQENDRNDSPSPELEKAIAAFGRRSALTFDGREYEMEEFASECMFLLARDLCTSSFTVLGGKKKIQILLPDVTVCINDNNQVFVNGNQVPAELSLKTSVGEVVVKRHEAAVEVHSPFLQVFCRAGDFQCSLQLRSTEIMGLLSATDMSSYKGFSLHEKDIDSKRMSSYEVSGKTECENLRFHSIHPYLNEVESSYSRPLSHFTRTLPKQFLDVCKSESKGGTDSHLTSEDFPPYSLRNEKCSTYNRDVWIDFRTVNRKCSSVRRSWWTTVDECL